MEVKIKDWVIKRYIADGWYLVDTSVRFGKTDVPDGFGQIVANKAKLVECLDVDEKELDKILEQVKSN